MRFRPRESLFAEKGSVVPDPDPTPSPTEDETLMSLSGSGATLNAEQELPAGTKLGKYQIKQLIGRGGMGLVYLAMDTLLRREVALKVLPTALTEDQQALKRFVREAQLAARLNHPNAVTVFDIARKKGLYFIAMELIRGQSADELVRAEGALGFDRATRLIADACRALVAAHGAGLIHRDIKPANILVGDDGATKLADFGLAKLNEAVATNQTLTQKDAVVGTPKYMSPEQCQNEPLDVRTDLYSLGATYYALVTGNAPYDTGTTMQILFAHCSQPVPDPSQSVAGLPAGCTRVIHKSMAKDREARYASAQAMFDDLEKLLSHTPLPVPIEALEADGPGASDSFNDTLAALAESSSDDMDPVPMAFPVANNHAKRKRGLVPIPLVVAGAGGGLVVGIAALLVVMIGGDTDGEASSSGKPGLSVPVTPNRPSTENAPLFASAQPQDSTDPADPTVLSLGQTALDDLGTTGVVPRTTVRHVPDPDSIRGVLTGQPAPEVESGQPPANGPQEPAIRESEPETAPPPVEPRISAAQFAEYRARFATLRRQVTAAMRSRDAETFRQAIADIQAFEQTISREPAQELRDMATEIRTFLDETRELMERQREQNPNANDRPGPGQTPRERPQRPDR